MMMKCQQKNVIYVDSGFLEQRTSTATSVPTYNAGYPESWSSTKFPCRLGDSFLCQELNAFSANVRVRIYDKNGNFISSLPTMNGTVGAVGAKYGRFMLVQGNVVPGEITIKHEDDTTTEYKIIDRRGD